MDNIRCYETITPIVTIIISAEAVSDYSYKYVEVKMRNFHHGEINFMMGIVDTVIIVFSINNTTSICKNTKFVLMFR